MSACKEADLFKQPDSTHLGDCPICCLPLPMNNSTHRMMPCCSKIICDGCSHANKRREIEQGLKQRCAFCREPLPETQEELHKMVMKRVKKNDPDALSQVGYKHQRNGDYVTAIKYWTKAAELGDVSAHYELSVTYLEGQGIEKDMKKYFYHAQQAAIGGHLDARFNLGCSEALNGRFERAKKHFTIAANLGCHDSLKHVMKLCVDGHASKEDYAAALRAYQTAVEAMKSAEREEACSDATELW